MQIVKGLGVVFAVLFLSVSCNSKSENKTESSNGSDIPESADLNQKEIFDKASKAICV